MKLWVVPLFVLFVLGALSLGVFTLAENSPLGPWVAEQPSPGDWIREEQITIHPDQVILDVSNAGWFRFTDTNSMDPFIDADSNAIVIRPSSPDVIVVGDVITYRSAIGIIIHRVVATGEDESGVYFLLKGDNNPFRDPVKVRFADVEGVVVAVIY